jgi:twitching motility protein PilJ
MSSIESSTPSQSATSSSSTQARTPPGRPPFGLKWFSNLPIGRKQFLALFICELIPILGFGIGSTIVLTNSLRTQLFAQTKSELAVSEINYNIKINQMGFGGRGQADHPTMITAAKNHQRNDNQPNDLQDQLRLILQNEVKARKIEYATLVGRDLRIIANANTNRAKEKLNPGNLSNLIQQVLKDGQQIKATKLVSWDELTKEAPPLPDGLSQKDSLIRYVVTPVRDPNSREVIATLVLGDIVNRKRSIVEDTLTTFKNGYSAIYQRDASNTLNLATSLHQTGNKSEARQFGHVLSEPSILQAAIAAKGEPVTRRVQIQGETYTVAAKTIPNQVIETPEGSVPIKDDTPVAILVRGTPEDNLSQLLTSSLQQNALILALSLAAILGWNALFRRLVLQPLAHLRQTTEGFAEGDRTLRAEIFSRDEVGQLATAFNQLAENLTASESVLAAEAARQTQRAKQARALSEITVRMRRSLNSNQMIQTAINEIREFLSLDRILVCQFENDSPNATVIAESIERADLSVIDKVIEYPIGLEHFEDYQKQSAWCVDQNMLDQISDRYRQLLHDFGVKAEVIAPLKRNQKVVGLLCGQQCDQNRQWQPSEVEFLTQITNQLSHALDQVQLLQERQTALQDSETLKNLLQQQITQFLGEIRGASQGDLTVRASTTSSDLGRVAEFYNAMLDRLQAMVVPLKQSTSHIHQLLSENEGAVGQLAAELRQQTQETGHLLQSIAHSTTTLQGVADRANQAVNVAQTATTAAESGEALIDSTVTSIYSLRSTIEDATRKVKQLGDSSIEIGRIVSVINDLAVQTDLLAINANIEATRAGESGRGFGIVATEIADLAARSAAATREIASVIEMIQRQTNEVVEAMTHGSAQVVEGSHLARNAKQSAMYGVQVAQQMDGLVKSISETITAQTQTSQSATELVKTLCDRSSHSLETSDRVRNQLQHTIAATETLHASVGQFRVQEVAAPESTPS